jgi:cellulose synthase/poly-beta-1,6-N-acetylglucosamine synthase-like glycosyltransferase
LTLRLYREGYTVKFVPASVTWEQEPQTLRVWLRQRNRWVRGHNYLLRRYAAGLLVMKPRRVGLELLYSLWLYYVFFLAIIVSDVLFVLGASGVLRVNVPGPYGVIWIFAYLTFVLQLVISLAREGAEDTPRNILLVMLMYFTYCQLWIFIVIRAMYLDFVRKEKRVWDKTVRFELAPEEASREA